MDTIPNRAPRIRPDRRIAIMNLVDGVGVEVMIDLQYRRPIDGSGTPVWSIQKESEGWYLALRMAERSGFLLVAMFQAEWMKRLLLTNSMSLMPRPPCYVGLHISSQER
jgi:hypothetical protein